ncbi:MAG: riboflavin biosynthesis protein RibD [Candidatus Fraserbacteria bacterium RBG_16_55_9]|uniref:Riboflavin biosynthesis protein RibD n=1 Tax=Fraserbacteria sp. (strain RBG_16_55_9) TaxID=1817864 RepID=A0A1F5V1R7_FRAXR|nr:MAG: riboflavin biosynthesis protein RibD [Candidatus Fraserbacteria bacterium RBG_16_55_9]
MEQFMRRALVLAEQGVGRVNPNPLVGAVVVKDGRVIAEAYHSEFGGPHAEALALKQAGRAAQGSELYVNWEPCIAYPGKRNPACVHQIITSGIGRVVVAARDPTPQVNGRGIAELQRAGIEVIEGILSKEAQQLNEIRAKYASTGVPFVLLKMAMTADGKIATRAGDSRWISSEESLQLAHRLRVRYAALLVGIGTVLQDDPQLTVRRVSGRDPMRIVLDSKGRIPLQASVLHLKSEAPTVLATCDMPAEKEHKLKEKCGNLKIWRLPANEEGHVDLRVLLKKLGAAQIDSLLIEGGSTVAEAFLRERLLDKFMVIIAPKIIGGRDVPTPVGGKGAERIEQAFRLKDCSFYAVGPDVVYQGYLDYSGVGGSWS